MEIEMTKNTHLANWREIATKGVTRYDVDTILQELTDKIYADGLAVAQISAILMEYTSSKNSAETWMKISQVIKNSTVRSIIRTNLEPLSANIRFSGSSVSEFGLKRLHQVFDDIYNAGLQVGIDTIVAHPMFDDFCELDVNFVLSEIEKYYSEF